MAKLRTGLFSEIIMMAVDTLRTNKLRSFLTVLGIVIGITSIVGMTAVIRGFDGSLRDAIKQMGPETIFLARFSGVSMTSGLKMTDLFKRPNLKPEDAAVIERQASSVELVDLMLGEGGPPTFQRMFYGPKRTKLMKMLGTTAAFAQVQKLNMTAGRFFTDSEVEHRRRVIVLGQGPYLALFENTDPIGKTIRMGNEPYSVIGVLDKRPSLGGFNMGQDDIGVVPESTFQKQFGMRLFRDRLGEHRAIMIAIVPREGLRDQAMQEVEEIMRIRHGLRLDKPNDFDLVTQDAALKVWDQVTGATFLALVAISSIALMVGGIGVMAIMTISVTERTREIGVRKALGARRREILWQFLMEAAFLTSIGGLLGVIFGSAIGLIVHWLTSFPISLPLWSFALGIGFSAAVGIFFGLLPAVKASRLDPIEALRYE